MSDQERYWQALSDEIADRVDRLHRFSDEAEFADDTESPEDRADRLYHEEQDRIAEGCDE